MRLRVVAPILLALAAVVGLVLGAVLPGRSDSSSAAGPSDGATVSASGDPSGTASTDPGTGDPNASVAKTNGPQPQLTFTKLKPGEKPPQFVVVSFDGACKDELFKHYLDVAKRNNARFTFFLSGLCILPEQLKFQYHPPLKPVGSSAIGFATASLIPDRIRNMTTAYNSGMDIGTHVLGHFCGPGGVGEWNTAQWESEIHQFNKFLNNWRTNLGSPLADGVPALPFNSTTIDGIRTPCLEGKRSQMFAAFKAFGYKYDASGGEDLSWPKKNSFGLWEFPLETIKVIGYGRSNLSMDYNLLCAQNNCKEKTDQATADRIQQSTLDSYNAALKAVCHGNRAPLNIGNHFNTWANGAYKNALTEFIDGATKVCPDVKFISFADMVKWLEIQDPTVLADLRARGAQSQ